MAVECHNQRDTRLDGLTLVEVTISIVIFVLISLSVFMTLTRGMEHRRFSFQMYRAVNALRDQIAEVQETANLPQSLPNQEGIGAIYDRYNSTTATISDLPSAQIAMDCFANEATVPAVLGGPQDLNFDGDAQDDLSNISNGSDLRLVPMAFTLTFAQNGITQTITMHRLITKTTD